MFSLFEEMKKALNLFVYLMVLLLSVLFMYYGNQYINSHKADGGMNMHSEEELDTLVFAKIISLNGETEDAVWGKKLHLPLKPLDMGTTGQKSSQDTKF
jgi:hypothetical protein